MAGAEGPEERGGAVTVEERIVSALAPFGAPVEASLLYAAARDLPPRYYTFSCSSFGDDFGDNEDIQGRVKQTKQALHRAGFTWPSCTDASDQDGKHVVFECEIAEEADLHGEI